MTLSGHVQEGAWVVDVQTTAVDEGGYRASVHVQHSTPAGVFQHTFQQARKFGTEREAVLDGLREGMTWIELKMARTIHV